ncbi:MAG: DUF2200 family protein [Bryobacterales bacterium]|nr:DUF2200 family protein [Bryobacterales bacterium]
MTRHRIFSTPFATVYPAYVQKAERKGRTQHEVDQIICWLTGYDQAGLRRQIELGNDFETFFAQAPAMHPNRTLIRGVVCGIRVEEIADPLMQEIRYLDKLVDELAKGRPMEKILRQEASAPPQRRIAVPTDIQQYNAGLEPVYKEIGDLLAGEIGRGLPAAESRIWHSHPVWFLNGNPIVGYSRHKAGVRLMFWSGADFKEPGLNVLGEKFKDASVFYDDPARINTADLRRWLKKSEEIQWDYKNLVRRKGRLERLQLK